MYKSAFVFSRVDAAKSVVVELTAEPLSRFLFRDASECVSEHLGGLWDCDCNCNCDPVGELDAEAGSAGLRKTYAKSSDGAASNGFMDNNDKSDDERGLGLSTEIDEVMTRLVSAAALPLIKQSRNIKLLSESGNKQEILGLAWKFTGVQYLHFQRLLCPMVNLSPPGHEHKLFVSWAKEQGVRISGVRPVKIQGRGLGIVADRRIEVLVHTRCYSILAS